MKRAPNASYWYSWKHGAIAYAPNFHKADIGDHDGEWRRVCFGIYRLVVDLRGWR